MSVEIYSSGTLVNTAATIANATITSGRGDGDRMHIVNGGSANSTTVNSGGYIYISSGGTAASTTVNSYGCIFIYNNGMANDTTVNHFGNIYISSGGTANRTTMSSGSMRISSGGVADSTTVNSGGSMYISSGGTSTNVAWTPCVGTIYVENSAYVTYTSTYSGVYFGSDDQLLSHTDTMTGKVVSGSPFATGSMFVMSGGIASNTTVDSCGDMFISSGGVANSTTMNGGEMRISSGGVANNTTISRGHMYISSGGSANNTTVSAGGILLILSGGSATNINWTPCIGYVSAFDEAYVTYANQHLGIYFGSDNRLLSHTVSMSDKRVSGSNSMYIMNLGEADNTTINDGIMYIFSGGTARSTLNQGSMCIQSGGSADNTVCSSLGYMDVFSGGTITNTQLKSYSNLYISAGGTASKTWIGDGEYHTSMKMYIAGNTYSTTVNCGGEMRILSGGVANSTTVNSSGCMYISSGGAANSTILSGYSARIYISGGGAANNTTINYGCSMFISSGGVHRGSLQIEAAVVSAYRGAVVDFTLVGRTASDGYLINNIALVKGAPTYTITVSAAQANGTYKLAQGAANFNKTLTIGDGTVDYGSITVNGDDLVYNGVTYSLDKADGNLTLTVSGATSGISNLQASATGASWSGNAETVEYSQDNFATSLKLNTSGSAIDTFQTPAGAWQVRVDADAQASFTAANPGTTAAQLISDADGNMDVFFAKTNGTWQGKNIAKHAGTLNGWTGTHERAAITGKNKIEDIFTGSTDANVLFLTDDTNGDALFLDDIYSTFGNQARLSQIDEIRAGAGDDVVDLTSPKFAYVGDNMTVYGGSGNDTIWANSGSNTLYGDAGNDRIVGGGGNDFIIGGAGNDSMHGGGGNDTFCFGGNWGTDTVEQLANGKVILRFETGSLANWNASTQTYTAGNNSVTVTGTSDIELYFGTDSTLPAGAFLDASSNKIFEDINSGMLA